MKQTRRHNALKLFSSVCAVIIVLACSMTPSTPITPTPLTVIPLQGKATVVVDVANLRTGPGEGFDQAASVGRGEVLTVLGVLADKSWYLVTKPDLVGRQVWISGRFITLAPAETPTRAITPLPASTPTSSLRAVDTPTNTGTATPSLTTKFTPSLRPVSTPSNTPTIAASPRRP